jgi:hypothetical protein
MSGGGRTRLLLSASCGTAVTGRQPGADPSPAGPTGSCTLILGFGGPIRLHGPAGPMIPTAFLAGMHDGAVITEFTGHQQGVQVDLTRSGCSSRSGGPCRS